MDFMTGLKRTDYCGDLRITDAGKEVTVAGWVQRQRDLGALIFVDLRDRTGIVQLAFDDNTDREVFNTAFTVRSEFVLLAKGVIYEMLVTVCGCKKDRKARGQTRNYRLQSPIRRAAYDSRGGAPTLF